MPLFRDSLGNTYTKIVHGGPDQHKAKKRRNKPLPKRTHAHGGTKKPMYASARDRKYARYRRKRGKPNGPGQPGNKSGKNKLR